MSDNYKKLKIEKEKPNTYFGIELEVVRNKLFRLNPKLYNKSPASKIIPTVKRDIYILESGRVSINEPSIMNIKTGLFENTGNFYSNCTICNNHFGSTTCKQLSCPPLKTINLWMAEYLKKFKKSHNSISVINDIFEKTGIVKEFGIDGNSSVNELRFHPMSLKYIHYNVNLILFVLSKLKFNGYVENINCGMHIHIDVDRTKFTKVISSLYKEDYTFFHQMSDRDGESSYYSQAVLKVEDNYFTTNSVKYNDAFNTMEIRIFQTTLNVTTFLANVELIDSLICMCESKIKPTMSNYIKIINTNRHANLIQKLQSYGYEDYVKTIMLNNSDNKPKTKLKLIKENV